MLINNDPDILKELQYELLPDEKLLWVGKPKGGIVLRTVDFFLVPFTLAWFGGVFSIFFVVPFPMMLFAIPFLIVGLYVSIGRFYYDMKLRSKTFYGITNNRIIVKSGIIKKTVDTFNIRTLQKLNIQEKSDGSGNIKIGLDTFPFSGFAISGWPGIKPTPQLERIPDVRSVYNMILQQQHLIMSTTIL